MAKDILINTDKSAKIVNGDFTVGDSDAQHLECLLLANKGEYKETPQAGIGVVELLNDESNPVAFKHEARKQIEADGATVNTLSFKDGKLKINATYP